MIITTPALEDATGHVADMYHEDIADGGFVHTYTAAMAVNPEAHQAFVALMRAVVPSIGVRVFEAATLGAARAIGSSHCMIAHGRKSLKAGVLDEVGLRGFAADDDRGFDTAEQAVIRYAEKLSTAPTSMTDADAAGLRELGFTDRQIVDITLAAGLRNHFSRTLLALAVPLDADPQLDAGIAAALVRRAAASGSADHSAGADSAGADLAAAEPADGSTQ